MAGGDGRGLSEGISTVTFGTIALIVATLCLVLLNFLARVLVIRSISGSDWNAFSLGFTLAQVLAAIGALGVPTAVARALPYATSDDERRSIVRASLWAGGLASAAAGLSLFLAAPTIGHDLGSSALGVGLPFFAVAVASLIASALLAAVFQGFADVLPNALFVQILNPALFLGFLAVALWVPPAKVTYHVALIGYAVANALTLLALVGYSARTLRHRLPAGPHAPGAARKFLRVLAPFAVLGAMTIFAGSGDTLILGAYGYAEVGVYTASLTLARLVQIGIAGASYIFLPVAARFLARDDRRAVGLTYSTITKWLTVLSLPLFVVFFFLPSSALGFVYGPNYATVIAPLQIVVLGAFAGTLLGPGAMTQVAMGDVRWVASNSVAAASTDVALAFLLVPTWGDVGAAVAWACANVLFASLCVAELASVRGIHPFGRDYLVPLAVILVPAALIFGLLHPSVPQLLLPALALGVAGAFVLVILATRSVGDGDRLLLEAIEGWTGRRLPLVRRVVGRRSLLRRSRTTPSSRDVPRPPPPLP